MYKVNTFLLSKIANDQYVLQNGKATVIIKSKKLVSFLEVIEKERMQYLTIDIIKNYFEDQTDDAVNFLLENLIICETKKETKGIKCKEKVLIYNDIIFKNYFEATFKDQNFRYIHSNVYEQYSYSKNDVVIIFLNPFNLKKYADMCNYFRDRDLIFKMIFFYNHAIYISQYHKKEWYNPCPMCFFYNLETQLRGGINSREINFQILIDMIYKQTPLFQIESKLQSKDYINVMYIFANHFNNGEDISSFINKVYEIDLASLRINEDVCYHWEACDCYE